MEESLLPLRRWLKGNMLASTLAVVGLALGLGGIVWWTNNQTPVEVEILSEVSEDVGGRIWVDIQGAVEKPGVYEVASDARLKDVLLAAGGLSSNADRGFVARYVNLAQKVSDGIKIYVPKEGEAGVPKNEGVVMGSSVTSVGGLVNINTASQQELEKLKGIGESRAKAIIEGRPYSAVDELKSKKILTQGVFEGIKNEVSVY